MEEISPTPEDSISDAVFISEEEYRPVPTGLQQAAFTCPECGEVVVKIVGNTMHLLYSHIRVELEKPDEQGYFPVVFCHTVLVKDNKKGDMFVPPRAYVPPPALSHPFLNVQTTEMISHPKQ